LCWLVFGLLTNNMPVAAANAVTMVFAVIILGYKIKYR
jgi:MtN3 and saliva related transmembrane protein